MTLLASLLRVARGSTVHHHLRRQTRSISRTLPLLQDDLPYHIVMGMPALSPTMESGSIAEWYVKEGESFIAGDSLAKIETDKASMDFEAQDDGFVAKLLAEAGGSDDITVGVPIMVTVEEAEDIGAFANYSPPLAEAAPPKEEAPPVAAAVAATPPPPPPAAAPKPVAAAVAPPAPVAAAPTPVPATSGWGSLALVNSPLVKALGKQQSAYTEKYGTTGQIPL